MKAPALVFTAVDTFEVRELTLDEPGPGDIVVKTLVTAISPGTERWTLRGKHIGTEFPCVPGYHRIGVVEQCGEEVDQFNEGDVVYGSGGRWTDEVVSMWGAPVGRSVSAPASYHLLSSSPLDLSDMEKLSSAILAGVSNRGMNACEVAEGEQMLSIGAGLVGVCAAQLAASRGAHPVVLDKNPERVAFLAEAQPQLTCLCVDDPELADRLREIAPDGFDILQDTVGHAPTTDAMVQHVRPQGKLLLQAQYFDKEHCAIDLDQIKIKELTVKTTCGTRQEDWEQTIANIRASVVDTAALITHRFEAPAELLKGYELLHAGTPHNFGIVYHWARL